MLEFPAYSLRKLVTNGVAIAEKSHVKVNVIAVLQTLCQYASLEAQLGPSRLLTSREMYT